ncbi:MAG TPA: hypothetical protein VFI31_26100 [Pirellulales bacterium]|nr:hypothetical protein [Pirellulales bacterium]
MSASEKGPVENVYALTAMAGGELTVLSATASKKGPVRSPLMQNAKYKMQNKKWRKRPRRRAAPPLCHFAFVILHFPF